MNRVFSSLPTTIFETMSRLAREHDAVNLGQGFPDHPGPEGLRAKAAEAVLHGSNQYPPMMGLTETREAVAAHYAATQGLDLDPMREVMITSGATEALAGALFALLEPGDEVILFQPLYDAYAPLVLRAGGVPRYVTLRPPHWRIQPEALRRAVTPRTRAILFNNPLNPAGTVADLGTLRAIADLAIAHDLIVISDEVWEEIIFDGQPFTSIMALKGMRERSVKIGSAGKMFSMTGWKIGFVCAAPNLMPVLAKAHQFLTFTTPPNLQAAIAHGLRAERGFLATQRARLEASRDRFARGLKERGFEVLPAASTYFLNIRLPDGSEPDDAFCRRLVREAGVAAIPVSAFYAEEKITDVVRFCFAKSDGTLDRALERLETVRMFGA
jgi:N-succinyldiaminopimelate aminotransferase